MKMSPIVNFCVTLLLGWLGIHKFAEGKVGMGVLYLFTFGLFGIGWIVDIVKAGIRLERNFQNQIMRKGDAKEFGTGESDRIRVAGTAYYMDAIDSLAVESPDWRLSAAELSSCGKINRRIYRYNYRNRPVTLVQEPRNKHDKNAVMVWIDGKKIGYIPAEYAPQVKEMLAAGKIRHMSAFIGGGESKIVYSDGRVEKDRFDISASVTLYWR